MGNKLTGSNKVSVFMPLALAVCAVALYARTLGYGYVWDDQMYLAGFQQYQGVAGALRAVAEPFFFYPGYYRPLVMLSFVVSAEPAVQHGINVVLHAVNVALVFLCARVLMPHEAAESRAGVLAAALGALAFAVHPIAVEPVTWVSGRFDTLMCSFVLGTCLVALGGELTRRRLALVFVLFFAAMCSKESAIGLPLALPLLLLLKWRLGGVETGAKEKAGQLVRLLAVLALGAALYIAIRLAVIQRIFAAKEGMIMLAGDGEVDKLNIAALAVTAFVKLMVNPWSHSAPLHPFSYEAGSGVQANTLVVLGCVPALLVLALLKKPRLNFPLALLAALAMSWPVLHIIGIPQADEGGSIIADRYALVPLALFLAGLAATVGAWLARRASVMEVGERRALVYAGVFGLLWAGALAAHTNVTIPMWRNEMVLWDFTHRLVPASGVAYSNYIVHVLMGQERWAEAAAEAKKYLHAFPERAHNPTLADVNNFMFLRAKSGDYKGAIELFEAFEKIVAERGVSAVGLPHEVGAVYCTRAVIEGEAGNWGGALRWHEKSLQVTPTDMRNKFLYAKALFMAGRHEESDDMFNQAISGSMKGAADYAVEWRKTWQQPAERAAQGASAAASAPVP